MHPHGLTARAGLLVLFSTVTACSGDEVGVTSNDAISSDVGVTDTHAADVGHDAQVDSQVGIDDATPVPDATATPDTPEADEHDTDLEDAPEPVDTGDDAASTDVGALVDATDDETILVLPDDVGAPADTSGPSDAPDPGDAADACTDCPECVADDDCPVSENPCEMPSCEAGSCSLVAVSGCCVLDVDCADADACTTDLCKWNACFHVESDAGCCTVPADCDDGNACTIESCSTAQCISSPDPEPPEGCCQADSECDDDRPCTTDVCEAGQCRSTGPETCCVVDGDCDDGVACTADTCVALGCVHEGATPECCKSDGDCDDTDVCTTDRCIENACVSVTSTTCDAYTFAAIADIPYDATEAAQLSEWIAAENALEPRLPFMLHLGDIKPGFAFFFPCVESIYADVSKLLLAAELPVYVVPGDNEWNDCGDTDAAWTLWSKYFSTFEAHWPDHPPTVHQPVRPENMAFAVGPAVFIGLNLVGGTVHDPEEWATRMQQNVEWIDAQLALHADRPTAVVFAHGEESTDTKPFFDGMRAVALAWGKPILYLHGDGHEFKNDQPWPEPNLYRIELAADGAKPIHITIQAAQSPVFAVDQEPF